MTFGGDAPDVEQPSLNDPSKPAGHELDDTNTLSAYIRVSSGLRKVGPSNQSASKLSDLTRQLLQL
jgi:hypothetical protein